ncbi:MAG: DNA-binding protein [Planctomycetota bacterium]|nr:MAG: DNA-binding protein [Planctomycetota bacterium]
MRRGASRVTAHADHAAAVVVTAPAAEIRDLRERLAAAHAEIARLHSELATTRAVPPPAAGATPRPPLLRACDVAALLRVNARTIRQWRTDRVFPPCVAIEGVVRWREADIDEWIASRVEGRK